MRSFRHLNPSPFRLQCRGSEQPTAATSAGATLLPLSVALGALKDELGDVAFAFNLCRGDACPLLHPWLVSCRALGSAAAVRRRSSCLSTLCIASAAASSSALLRAAAAARLASRASATASASTEPSPGRVCIMPISSSPARSREAPGDAAWPLRTDRQITTALASASSMPAVAVRTAASRCSPRVWPSALARTSTSSPVPTAKNVCTYSGAACGVSF